MIHSLVSVFETKPMIDKEGYVMKMKVGLIVAIEMDAIFLHYQNWKKLESPPGFSWLLVEREALDV